MIKITFLLTFFLAFGNPAEKWGDYHKEYYQNGTTKAEGWMKNGQKDGYWRFYHPNGKLSEKGHFTTGKRTSYWYFYSEKGKLEQEGHYENGTKADWWLFYDAQGKINHKCQLSGGKKNGYCLQYRNNDIVKAEKYSNGKKIKAWYSFSSFKKENNLSDLR